MSRSFFRRSTTVSLAGEGSTWHDAAAQRVKERQEKKARILDEAYEEYCRIRESGGSLSASEFCERYPSYRHSLRRLIDVHVQLEDVPEDEYDAWPECGSDFLGFHILHELGIGAIARVYLAAEQSLGGRHVAVKVSLYGDCEAETLGRLSHPGVVPVHSVQVDPATNMTAVCMPFLGIATLADVLDVAFSAATAPESAQVILDVARSGSRLMELVDGVYANHDPDRILTQGAYVDGVAWLGVQIAEALAYTHERGVLHRDLKPSNVLLTPHGRPMLLDFNLSCDVATDSDRVGGTLPYMPPEQIREVLLQAGDTPINADPRSDVFSLGVILYEMLTGRLPFGDPSSSPSPRESGEQYLEAQRHPPICLRERNPRVDVALATTIERCLAPAIEDRPASAAEVAEQLRRRFTRSQWLRRWCGRHRRTTLAATALLSLVTLASVLYSLSLPPRSMREYRAGVRDFQVGQLKRSLDHFERSLRSDPQFVPAVIGRGVTRQQLGDHPYSVPDLRTASENSSDGVVMECLAYALFKTGQSQPAAATYELAIRSRPDSAQLRVNQACAAMRGGQLSAAEKTVTEAIELDPHLQAAYLLRAEVRLNRLLSGRGALEEVLHDLRCAARSGPPCWSIELYTAVAYARAAKQNADLEEVVAQHLRAAVQLGVQRTLLERQRLLDAFRDRPWLRAAIEEASPNRGAEPFNPVTSPDPRAVASLLARMAR